MKRPRAILAGTRIGIVIWLAATVLFLSWNVSLKADDHDVEIPPAVPLSETQGALARKLHAEVMSPCCYGTTVDHHQGPSAERVRRQIDNYVAAGNSRQEILNSLEKEYTARILAKPKNEGFGSIFYVAPVAATLAGLGLVYFWLKRSVRTTSESAEQLEAHRANAKLAASSTPSAWDDQFERQIRGD